MAVIRKRGKTYQLDWRDATGVRQRESLGQVDAATARAALTRKKLELLGNPTGSIPATTVEEFSKQYLTWYRAQFPNSYDRVWRIFKNHINPKFGAKPLNVLTVAETTEWLISRIEHVQPESANKELKAFKAMCNRAVEWGAITVNPIKGVQALRERTDKVPHFYVAAQLKKLYKASSPRNAAMWKFLANMGLRRQEAINLQSNSCATKQITVLSTNDAPTKGASTRVVPLNAEAKAALAVLQKLVRNETYVFPRMNPRSLSRLFKEDAARAKLPGSIHSLRHTFGANLTMAGVPLRSVQILMGHASIETTEIYASLAPDYLSKLTTKIAL